MLLLLLKQDHIVVIALDVVCAGTVDVIGLLLHFLHHLFVLVNLLFYLILLLLIAIGFLDKQHNAFIFNQTSSLLSRQSFRHLIHHMRVVPACEESSSKGRVRTARVSRCCSVYTRTRRYDPSCQLIGHQLLLAAGLRASNDLQCPIVPELIIRLSAKFLSVLLSPF